MLSENTVVTVVERGGCEKQKNGVYKIENKFGADLKILPILPQNRFLRCCSDTIYTLMAFLSMQSQGTWVWPNERQCPQIYADSTLTLNGLPTYVTIKCESTARSTV